MALIILDPNLEGESGHHLAYDLAIAREAMARGQTVTIVANRRFGVSAIEGVRVLPHFTATTYAVRHDDPVTGRFDDIRHFNDLLGAELALLPADLFGPRDAVLAPTVTETHLAGLLGWMKGFEPASAPLFVVHLMFPSGVALDAAGVLQVEDPIAALAYRLAGRVAEAPGPPVHLFASGRQHAVEFSTLFGRPVPAHPLPILPDPPEAVATSGDRVLLFAGDARADKGIALLPPLVDLLAPARPGWTFAAHVNSAAAWGEAAAAATELRSRAALHPNLALAEGRLQPEAYTALLAGARIALLPYDPQRYRRKSSGVLWEAVCLGLPVVVPEGTWLENEARHWGAGHVAYAAQDPAAIAAALGGAIAERDALAQASAGAALRYRAANGAAALLDQIGELWVRHAATMSLVARPAAAAIDLAQPEEGWHRPELLKGKPVRWTDREPVLVFDWPFATPWQVELTLLTHFGAAQLERAEAQAGGLPVTLAFQREGTGGRLLASGPGPGRARPRVALRIRLAHTHRPPNDARDLGVLVAAIRIGPAGDAPRVEPAPRPCATVLSAPAAEGGWPLAASGMVMTEAGAPCVLAFRFAESAVPAMRAVRLFLAGREVPLILSAEAAGGWLATVELPAALLAGADRLPWDLMAGEADAGPAPRLVTLGAAPLGGTPLQPIDAEAPAIEAEPSPVEAAPPEPVPPQAAEESAGEGFLWHRSEGFGEAEGPFPELGVPAGVRWVVSRRARLVVQRAAPGPARIRLAYRSLLLRQRATVTAPGAAAQRFDLPGGRLQDRQEATIPIDLPGGTATVALDFEGAIREPGTGRDLVLLIEAIALD
ncbi:hypothetical protein J5Y09_15595 [Roseomonas sp. PWR1]|uniref:Glycosyltransferase n=1 Tax=Roseomonas nitratireducens TaxID=2820810 RepID=A0ABS4AVF6_9PROT|nr:hypothetical protein [Neoroseomonas nitratireducens]MBP0465349.1 hypothetical protein [Neoroseomonas nitratireducens]